MTKQEVKSWSCVDRGNDSPEAGVEVSDVKPRGHDAHLFVMFMARPH